MFILVCTWFVGSLLFVIFLSGKMSPSSALSRLHMQFFFQNKKFQDGGKRVVAQVGVNVHERWGEKTTVS